MPLESGERMPKRSWMQRALRIEPGISLAQWAIDRVTSNWPVLSSAFVAGGGMSYLATLTAWASAAGPLGIGVIGLTTALLTNLLLAWAQAKRAQARERNVLAEITQNWVTKSDVINPLNPEAAYPFEAGMPRCRVERIVRLPPRLDLTLECGARAVDPGAGTGEVARFASRPALTFGTAEVDQTLWSTKSRYVAGVRRVPMPSRVSKAARVCRRRFQRNTNSSR